MLAWQLLLLLLLVPVVPVVLAVASLPRRLCSCLVDDFAPV